MNEVNVCRSLIGMIYEQLPASQFFKSVFRFKLSFLSCQLHFKDINANDVIRVKDLTEQGKQLRKFVRGWINFDWSFQDNQIAITSTDLEATYLLDQERAVYGPRVKTGPRSVIFSFELAFYLARE